MLDYQKSHPEKIHYVKSRFYTMTEEDSSDEQWMFIDEYENREDFDKTMKTFNEDPELIKMSDEFFPKWDTLIVPKSRAKGEVWTEVEKLRVEFK